MNAAQRTYYNALGLACACAAFAILRPAARD
jgi:hypothetical protein